MMKKGVYIIGALLLGAQTVAIPGESQTVFPAPLSVGGSAASAISDDISGIENVSLSGTATVLKASAYGSDVAPVLHFDKARGSWTSPSAPQSGDTLISIGARAWNDSNGFGGSSAAFICRTIENTASGQIYTAVDCTIGTTPTGGGQVRQDWFHFWHDGDFTVGGNGDPAYANGHSISVQSGSATATFELLSSSGVPQGSLDLNQNSYLWLGTRTNIPLYLTANSVVGITVWPSHVIQFNGYTNPGAIMNDSSGNLSSQPGVSCSGAPSSSFQSVNGIVVHC